MCKNDKINGDDNQKKWMKNGEKSPKRVKIVQK